MTAPPDLVFVYGTLRQGFTTEGRSLLERYGTFRSAATVEGRLYEVEGLPALVVEQDDGEVIGEVHQLEPLAEALAVLDGYEGAAGVSPGPYQRVVREVEMETGGTQGAWVYAWTGGLRGATPVTSGDYVAFVADR